MQSDEVTVTLAVGAAPWQRTLAASLLSVGMLRRVLSSGQYLDILDPDDDHMLQAIKRFPLNRLVDKIVWGTWRRLPRNLWVGSPVIVTVWMRDQLWSRWIPPCSVFHGWMGQSLASLPVAKRQGASTLLENAGRHPGDFHKASLEECDRFNIKPSERSPLLPEALIRRMEREYELCDRIAVPSTVAHSSFAKFGLADKAIVVPTGVDEVFYSPPLQPKERRLFRVCFAGRVELAKGVGYLLLAWKRIGLRDAELVLVGEVRPEMNGLLRAHADTGVRLTGVLPARELLEVYRESDVFALSSVNEGLAQVLLEAMATGLPVVASNLSGASDCVTPGKEGIIVPVRDVDRLAEAILWLYQHREEARVMGKAARAKIERHYTLNHYNQRMISLYRDMAGVDPHVSRRGD